MSSARKRIVVLAGWIVAAMLILSAGATLVGFRIPVPFGQVWFAKGTIRVETKPGPAGWRGHPWEIRAHARGGNNVLEVGIGPLGLAGLAAGVAAFLGRRKKAPPGHCRDCGYDLAGLRTKVCPECGAGILKSWLGRPMVWALRALGPRRFARIA